MVKIVMDNCTYMKDMGSYGVFFCTRYFFYSQSWGNWVHARQEDIDSYQHGSRSSRSTFFVAIARRSFVYHFRRFENKYSSPSWSVQNSNFEIHASCDEKLAFLVCFSRCCFYVLAVNVLNSNVEQFLGIRNSKTDGQEITFRFAMFLIFNAIWYAASGIMRTTSRAVSTFTRSAFVLMNVYIFYLVCCMPPDGAYIFFFSKAPRYVCANLGDHGCVTIWWESLGKVVAS